MNQRIHGLEKTESNFLFEFFQNSFDLLGNIADLFVDALDFLREPSNGLDGLGHVVGHHGEAFPVNPDFGGFDAGVEGEHLHVRHDPIDFAHQFFAAFEAMADFALDGPNSEGNFSADLGRGLVEDLYQEACNGVGDEHRGRAFEVLGNFVCNRSLARDFEHVVHGVVGQGGWNGSVGWDALVLGLYEGGCRGVGIHHVTNLGRMGVEEEVQDAAASTASTDDADALGARNLSGNRVG